MSYIILWVLAAVGAFLWASLSVLVVRAVFKLPRLEQVKAPAPESWPRVSFIVPACNEGAEIEAALRSKLRLDYPSLQVVLVDDRSTDDTGTIADRLAAEDSRLTVLHLRELPAGWLGKVHALRRGLDQATGEWLLFSDADIRHRDRRRGFRPDAA